MFKLELVENALANPVYFFYDPHTSTIIDADGNDIISQYAEKTNLSIINKISPENPGIKSHNIKTLKIQLGMGCNYSCSYCNQKEEVKFGSKTNIRDAEIFLSKLDSWLKSEPEYIEFWGGEPLLYWNKIKFLLEKLSEKFPKTKFLIITNGSLIDDEFIEYVEKYDVNVAISHDGPGQHVRGPDPFQNSNQFEMIKKLYNKRKSKLVFNSVLTPDNFDIEKIVEFFKTNIDDNVIVNLEGIVVNYEGGENNYFTEEHYEQLTLSVFKAAIQPKLKLLPCFANKIDNFIQSLYNKTPSEFVGQKCGMDREDNIAVDLLGNVMTCQNTGALGRHRI